jgi:hypothetical protein
MSVWLCIPSARAVEQAGPVLRKWRERGYSIAVWRDEMDWPLGISNYIRAGAYPGYAVAVNTLIRDVMQADSQAEWFVTGGDDVEPDANYTAEEIARQCRSYFYALHHRNDETFGVMQPTGDRWGIEHRHLGKTGSAYIDRVCGSPWMGREFCRRIYGGKGPLWPEFTHMFVDEHLQEVALRRGILWQRPDLIHYHRHWAREEGADAFSTPEHLKKWAGAQHWKESKAIFDRLKAGGFKEAEGLLP